MKFSYQWVPTAQKGARWFVRYGATTRFTKGFRTKAEASAWIGYLEGIDWRVGFLFRMVGDDCDVQVVDRIGRPA